MSCDEGLNHLERLILKLLSCFRQHLGDVCEVIGPYVLVPDVLENFSWQFAELIAVGMNEMAEVPACAARRSVEITTGHCAIVACSYQLVWIRSWIRHLLRELRFVCLLELCDCIARHRQQLVMLNAAIFRKQLHNCGSLIYKS